MKHNLPDHGQQIIISLSTMSILTPDFQFAEQTYFPESDENPGLRFRT